MPKTTRGPEASDHVGDVGTSSSEVQPSVLLKAGALQAAIFNSANLSSIATDANGVIQIFNVGAEKMLGYSAAEAVNKMTPAELSDPQELIARAKALSAEFDTPIAPGFEALVYKASRGIGDVYELTKIRKDGSRVPAVVSVTALRDPVDAIIGYLLIGTDNTERKRVEADQEAFDQRLRDQQFYTRSLLESSIDPLMVTDPKGVITDVNRQMEALTGCTRDELIGSQFRNYFTDSARAASSLESVLSTGSVRNFELTARSRDGTETVVSYNATTVYDRDRRLQGMFAAARDVTELKRFEEALSEKNAQLDAANEELEAFSYSVSHDLRAPLRHISGFSNLLLKRADAGMDEKSRHYVETIAKSVSDMGVLIDDLLQFSRSGRADLHMADVDMDQALLEALEPLREETADRDIEWSIGSLPHVVGDHALLRQVWSNLLGNAAKFSRDKSPARIEVGVLKDEHRQSDLSEDVFFVRDNGAGFDMAYADKLFGVFQRLHSASDYEGTGIGLANVQRIVRRHGGRVWAEAQLDKGATFYFALPKRME